ncbi:hypothetical protein AAFC00_003102 [Neodothiora populina]|uniref:Proteasome inhibitor PI31 subunit n=1 Tax=Neodothiora populina TaxID=2781224 RepID=A0ABR3P9L6_9PEZI
MTGTRQPHALASESLARFIAQSLSSTASPQIETPYDAIALASHAAMSAVGFRLIGLGEDHRIEAQSDPSHPSPLPAEWNTSKPNYAFRYAHSQSSMEYLLKVNRMGNKAVIMGMGLGDDRTATFDVRVVDYISHSSLPATPVTSPEDTSEAERAIIDTFISTGRLADFGALFRLSIIQKLAPGLHKPGYEDDATPASQSTSSTTRETPARQGNTPPRDPLRDDYQPPARPYPLHDPLAHPRPFPAGEFAPPGFEDPYDMTRPPRPMGGGMPSFGNIGERDLYPQGLGPRDGLWGGVGPGLGGGMGGGGMHPTFDDPLFAGQGRGREPYDPQAPPGSRYDPVGPGGAPRGSGGRGNFPGGGAGGRPHNPFGGFGGGDFI